VVNEKGEKLSKQTLAPALDLTRRNELLDQSFRFLRLPPSQRAELFP
jgi:glutamyl-Q tRNA(Asp) synthetase